MPEVEIRPALSTDLATLAAIDHTSKTDYVWQMDRNLDTGQLAVNFREIRLPRGIRIEYPHLHDQIVDNWKKAAVILMAVLANEPVGYVTIHEHKSTKTAWITDLVVAEHDRRQGIASALLLSAQSWATQRTFRRMVMEMHSKNAAAVRLALKMGFEFCGYNDQYYVNQDIALFFSCLLR